jgi:PEP-CTERM motif
MKRILKGSIALALSLLSAAPAQAITYIGSRAVGDATALLSVTTDNTLGGLTNANITDWSIQLSSGLNNVTLNGPLSGNNSSVLILTDSALASNANSSLIATTSDLQFNFDGNGFLGFLSGGSANGFGYLLNGAAGRGQCSGGGVFECVFFVNNSVVSTERAGPSGLQTLASVAPGGVPEPAAWALMIAGFGLVGGAVRRRAAVRVTYA